MEPLNAEIVIDLGGGLTPKKWSFQLSTDAPLDPEALLAALAGEFVEDGTEPSQLELTYAGTFGSPSLRIKRRAASYVQRKQPLS